MPSLVFRKGLDLKHAVAGMLADNYHSALVDRIKADDFVFRAGRLTLHLAREFGFCYGVDRAVDYAYQACERFPDRNVFLTGEMIHNPHVNEKLWTMGDPALAASPRFAPDGRFQRNGLGNLTARVRSESKEAGDLMGIAMVERYGEAALADRYQALDTICSATHDRQDAVVALLRDTPVDLM